MHLVTYGSKTVCGLSQLPDGDVASPNFATCPKCMPEPPPAPVHDRKTERISFLERKLAATRADLLLKFEDDDDHGVADAAMDCRDIRNELKGLRFE